MPSPTGRLKSRRGAVAVMVALMATVLMMAAAVAVDAGRLHLARTQLQAAADAAALAGAVELIRGPTDVDVLIRGAVWDAAERYASRNPVLGSEPTLDEAAACVWSATGPCDPALGNRRPDAVRVTLSYDASYLFAQVFGRAPARIRATATARSASVNRTNCVRPWAMAYSRLISVLPARPGGPERDLVPQDLAWLRNPANSSALDFVLKDNASGGLEQSDYGPVKLPSASHVAALPSDNSGSDYRDQIGTPTCNAENTVAVGHLLRRLHGNKTGPTRQGAEELGCSQRDGGVCRDAEGNVGIPVKVALWVRDPSIDERDIVRVKVLSWFLLTRVDDRATVFGRFLSLADGGPVGPVPSPMRRAVLTP